MTHQFKIIIIIRGRRRRGRRIIQVYMGDKWFESLVTSDYF